MSLQNSEDHVGHQGPGIPQGAEAVHHQEATPSPHWHAYSPTRVRGPARGVPGKVKFISTLSFNISLIFTSVNSCFEQNKTSREGCYILLHHSRVQNIDYLVNLFKFVKYL